MEPDYKHLLGELLAVIHRDGGHYVETHGWEKTTADAQAIVLDLFPRPTQVVLVLPPHVFEDSWDSFEDGVPGRCAFSCCDRLADADIHLPYPEHTCTQHPAAPSLCRFCGLHYFGES